MADHRGSPARATRPTPIVPDAPPTFEVREWPVDTLVEVTPTRTLFMLAKALRIVAPSEGRVTVGTSPAATADAAALTAQLERKYKYLRQVGWQRRVHRGPPSRGLWSTERRCGVAGPGSGCTGARRSFQPPVAG